MTEISGDQEQISKEFRKVLNKHGHGFQYAVLSLADQMYSKGITGWIFNSAEFPVVAGNETTHIDFLLNTPSNRTYLVAECKRVDPALGHWCFAKAPYTWRQLTPPYVVFDQFMFSPAELPKIVLCTSTTTFGTYHLGLELKTHQKGDGEFHGGKSTISQAVTQVLRGTSGLINYLAESKHGSSQQQQLIRFIPAIFTTANLWVTEADLSSAELSTGDLPMDAVNLKKVAWIWYTHNRSPALQNNYEKYRDPSVSRALKYEFERSIAMVSSDGIEKFLGFDLETWLDN